MQINKYITFLKKIYFKEAIRKGMLICFTLQLILKVNYLNLDANSKP